MINNSHPLTWSLCVATMNRINVLTECVALALEQTRPPTEVIVIDASDNWQANREKIKSLANISGVSLKYLRSSRKSTAAQRNAASKESSSEILFLIDDDSLMYPDCAAAIMKVYEADSEQTIACVGAASVRVPPTKDIATTSMKDGFGVRHRTRIISLARRSFVVRFVMRELLFLTIDRQFVPYDPKGSRLNDTKFADFTSSDLHQVNNIFGYCITVRRTVAIAEPFDNGLEGYSVLEDMDATYRFGRHGFVVMAPSARLFHAQVKAARSKIETVKTLEVTNLAYFVRSKSPAFWPYVPFFWLSMFRRCLAELLKDALAGRMKLGRFRATLRGMPLCAKIMCFPKEDLTDWYSGVQKKLMAR